MSLAPLPEPLNARLNAWLAVPWVDRGESLNGWDCWGLVRVVRAEAFGLDTPAFAGLCVTATDGAAVAAAVAQGLPAFTAVAPRPGAVCLFKRREGPAHVGVYLTGRHVLHAVSGRGTQLLDLLDVLQAAWLRRCLGAYVPHAEALGPAASG